MLDRAEVNTLSRYSGDSLVSVHDEMIRTLALEVLRCYGAFEILAASAKDGSFAELGAKLAAPNADPGKVIDEWVRLKRT